MNLLTKTRIGACLTILILGCAANSEVAFAQQLKPIVGSKQVVKQEPAEKAKEAQTAPETAQNASESVPKPAEEQTANTEFIGPVQPVANAAVAQDPPIITVTNQSEPIQPAANMPRLIHAQPFRQSVPVVLNNAQNTSQDTAQNVAPHNNGDPQYITNMFANQEDKSATPLQPFIPVNSEQAESNLPPIVAATEMNSSEANMPRMIAQPAMPLPQVANTSQETSSTETADAHFNAQPLIVANPQVEESWNEKELPPIVKVAELELPPVLQATEMIQTPVDQAVEAVEQALPPIVQASQLPTTPMSLQPVQQEELPPVVSSTEMAMQEPAVDLQKGANFPEDAQKRIAEFIKANQGNYSLVQQPEDNTDATEQAAAETTPETSQSVDIAETTEMPAVQTEVAVQEMPAVATPERPALQAGANQPVAVPMIADQIASIEQPSKNEVTGASYQPNESDSSHTVIVNPRLQQFPNHQPIQPVAMPQSPVAMQNANSRIAQAQSYSTSSTPIAQPYAPYPNQDVVVDVVPNTVGDAGQYFEDGNVDVDVVVDYGGGGNPYNDCGFCMDASGYFTFDTLIWHRADGDFRAGNFTVMDEFDWNYGGRVTVGNRWDCAEGREFSFMAFDPWTARTVETNAPGGLVGAIFPGGGLGLVDVSAFQFQTNYLEQWQKTELYSMDFNRVWWGWDVAKTFFGFRYMSFDDKFGLSASNLIGQQGFYNIDATNEMFGLHAGGMANYDYGRKWSYTLSADMGGYLDFMDGGQTLINGGNAIFANRVVETNFAWSLQLGAYLNYKIAPRARFRVGYEFLGLYSVLTTQAAYRSTITPRSGSSIEEGNTLFHGGVLGFDIYR